MAAEISKPDFSYQWASGGSIVAPSNVKVQTGWTAEVPPFQWENWSQNRQDNAILHLFQKGISEWDALSDYYFTASGVRSYVQGSNGVIYVAVADSVGQNPITDTSNTYWRIAFLDYVMGATPVGTLSSVMGTTAPVGTLKANGAAYSRATYAALFQKLVTDAGYTAQTFTVTIASPGLFTKTAHGFAGGERLRLSTTGALPTGLNTTTDYFVEVASANTYWLQSLDGSRIVTTGTQSGVHSYLQSWFGLGDGSTTFNVPDMRGEFSRGWDDGRGIDAGRQFGSRQLSTILSIGDPVNTGSSVSNLYNALDDDTSAFRARINSDGAPPALNGVTALTINSTGSVSAASASTYIRPRNIPVLYCIKY